LTLARTTLGNERVQMGGMLGFGLQPLELLQRLGLSPSDPAIAEQLGAVMAERICLEAMGLRALMRRMSGLQPGAEASVLKLATSWHQVRVAKAAMDWVGPMSATFADGPARESVWRYLSTPSQLIGGGTSEIQLNVIAERVLGLPRR
jgi:alkylation response protein AidB-like acyl-CoA dehydrogenase